MISQDVLKLLEYDKLLSSISEVAKSIATKRALSEIRPLKDINEITKRQDLIRDLLFLYRSGNPFPIFDLPDLAELFQKVKPEGAILEGRELYKLLLFFEIITDILQHLKKCKNIPFLSVLISPLTGFPLIKKALAKSIDSEGNILDSASQKLFEIRTEARRLTAKIKKRLQDLLDDPNIAKYLQDNFITQRGGRWVIPVRMDSKGQISGVVHDVSSTGQTAFIEPLAIIAISNELENILAEQKVEEIRILNNLTAKIRENISAIKDEYEWVLYLDMLNCISSFSYSLNMELPTITEDNLIKIINAKHPLMTLSFKKMEGLKKVVPLNVSLGGGKSVMIITGPNAGGKTIAIKTIGLLQLMAMSGMPVPADSSSQFPMFEDIFVDIGDEQSIESNLSTFSAHIVNISKIIENAKPQSLILIDEIGKGTDPDEGSALACAILIELRDRGSLTFATTHLSMIKVFAHKSEGMINASMEFDPSTFTPLYKLRIGEFGMSYTLEIAKIYGLQDRVIENAKKLIGEQKYVLMELISDLNQKRQYYERANLDIEIKKSELEEKSKLLDKRISEIKSAQNEIISKAYEEASQIISEVKREVNEVMLQAKEKSKESLKKLNLKQTKIKEMINKLSKEELPPIDLRDIHEGDYVFVKSVGRDALVVSKNLKLKQLKINIDGKDLIVSIEDVTFPRKRGQKSENIITEIKEEFEIKSTLNIIGKRVDEALSQLEPFLNKASLAGLSEVRVIHGVGKMILQKAIRQHLKGHPLVKSFRSAPLTEGGEGVTVISLL